MSVKSSLATRIVAACCFGAVMSFEHEDVESLKLLQTNARKSLQEDDAAQQAPPVLSLLYSNRNCQYTQGQPYDKIGDRLFRKDGIVGAAACAAICQRDPECKFFSLKRSDAGTDRCIGCKVTTNMQTASGFDLYAMEDLSAESAPGFGLLNEQTNCQYTAGKAYDVVNDRLFRVDTISSPEGCAARCSATPECKFFSYLKEGPDMRCIGCKQIDNKQTHAQFTMYEMTPTNYALGMTPIVTSQCYTSAGMKATYLTDGQTQNIRNNNYYHSCALHSPPGVDPDPMPTVTIPLNVPLPDGNFVQQQPGAGKVGPGISVSHVKVHNRCGCCSDRLEGFMVYAGSTLCGTLPPAGSCRSARVDCKGAVATEIQVKKENGNANFVEIEVFGKPVTYQHLTSSHRAQ
jgi:hypothetical protein